MNRKKEKQIVHVSRMKRYIDPNVPPNTTKLTQIRPKEPTYPLNFEKEAPSSKAITKERSSNKKETADRMNTKELGNIKSIPNKGAQNTQSDDEFEVEQILDQRRI